MSIGNQEEMRGVWVLGAQVGTHGRGGCPSVWRGESETYESQSDSKPVYLDGTTGVIKIPWVP